MTNTNEWERAEVIADKLDNDLKQRPTSQDFWFQIPEEIRQDILRCLADDIQKELSRHDKERTDGVVEWHIGQEVLYRDEEYVVCGLSTMIYDEDCEGEPEWKHTKKIQEVAIVKPFTEKHIYAKPAWMKPETLTTLRSPEGGEEKI